MKRVQCISYLNALPGTPVPKKGDIDIVVNETNDKANYYHIGGKIYFTTSGVFYYLEAYPRIYSYDANCFRELASDEELEAYRDTVSKVELEGMLELNPSEVIDANKLALV